jgi:L-amino acid N-acyltransferase YncA
MNTDLIIRLATPADAKELLEIYKPYIKDTAITFEYDIPSVSDFADRITQTLKKYPYLVAIADGRIIGYAYASPFKARAAYDWAVETTIYLGPDFQGKGYGKRLYYALEDVLRKQNILNLNACIAYASVEDIHLNNTSALFHERLGYTKVAHFTQCGYKFGTWYDMIWMEKLLGSHPDNPAPVIPITELSLRF